MKFFKAIVWFFILLLGNSGLYSQSLDVVSAGYPFKKFSTFDPNRVWKDTPSAGPFVYFYYLFHDYVLLPGDTGTIQAFDVADSGQNPSILGKALVYPNPFRLEEGAFLGYELSQNADIEIRIYDMKAVEIYKGFYMAGTPGGIKQYNYVPLRKALFEYISLPAGIYFFLITHNGKVLAKGKYGVKP